MADLTDLLLDLASNLAAQRNPEPARIPTTPQVESPQSTKKPSVRSKKAIEFLSTSWNSIDALARDMGLSVDVTYRKLYYLKGQDKVELRRGECRLKPQKLQLLRAEG
ncbi:putative Rossmann fold nucleotide-binding protein DprA/Smf involved in DNA uptake [Bradyrhizobium sp. USDA 4341]